MMTLADWSSRAIDVPFVDGGRDFDGWDCWGLVANAYLNICGIELPDHSDPYSALNFRFVCGEFNKRKTATLWTQTDPGEMAIAAIFRRGLVIHCGLMLDRYNVIHVESGVGTVVQRRQAFRIEGFYEPICRRAASV